MVVQRDDPRQVIGNTSIFLWFVGIHADFPLVRVAGHLHTASLDG
jgi:hypothetical protein